MQAAQTAGIALFTPAEEKPHEEEGGLRENKIPTVLQIQPLDQGPLTFSVSFFCFLLTVRGKKAVRVSDG